jgi:hypothetical protein
LTPDRTSEQYADELIAQFTEMRETAPELPLLETFLGAKNSLLGKSSLSVSVRHRMLEAYRIAEIRLFGKITELPGERELLTSTELPLFNEEAVQRSPQISSSASNPVERPIKSDSRSVDFDHERGANLRFTVRRLIALAIGSAIGLAGTWIPSNGSVALFLVLVGCGLVSIGASKAPWAGQLPDALSVPPIFMSQIVSLAVHFLGLVAFVALIVLGFVHHSWWMALLVWIPPCIAASSLFPGRNPSGPLFLGLLLVASGCVAAVI